MSRKYPAVFFLLFVLVGIVLADQARWPAEWYLLSALILCLIGIALFRTSQKAAALLFGLFMLSFSGYHFSIRYYDIGPGHITNFITDGERYQIFGRVIDWPLLKSSGTEIKISVDSLGPPVERAVYGAILLKVHDSTTALQRGDRIEFRSRVYNIKGGRSPGGFDYRRYLHLKGVFGVVYLNNLLDVRLDTEGRSTILSWIDKLRSEITASFYRNLGEAGASLAAGFLIGEIRNISPEVYQRFRDSGTLHLLAVSGSNVALVLAFVIIMLRPLALRRRSRSLVLFMVIVVFAMLSYGEPSVMRASIMASLIIGAGLVQRRYDLNNVIAVAALIILLYDPAQLFDVGFQLSFVVAWGLIYLLPRIHALFAGYHGRRWYRWQVLPIM
ncbi:MAG: ComEC/Rec2 family competence protein, partial [candidate division Zixibacteria bacterium]|nr:ComEC/Rec2 family competence protein [candidate division Zixibacteria bacterium]